MNASHTELTWNLVTHGIEDKAEITKIIQPRIDQLAKELSSYKPEWVHLLVSLNNRAAGKKDDYHFELHLKLEPTVLHVTKEGPSLSGSADAAFDELEERVQQLNERRGHSRWDPVDETAYGSLFGDPKRSGPRNEGDVLRNFIVGHYRRLLRHTKRRIARLRAETSIPGGAIDARDVVDEATRICLTNPEAKPENLTYELWLLQLIRDELDHEFSEWSSTQPILTATPDSSELPEDISIEDAIALSFDPDESLDEDYLPHPKNLRPDYLAENRDLIEEILQHTPNWRHREIFALYFIEGFSSEEIAEIEQTDRRSIEETIAELKSRLREIKRLEGV